MTLTDSIPQLLHVSAYTSAVFNYLAGICFIAGELEARLLHNIIVLGSYSLACHCLLDFLCWLLGLQLYDKNELDPMWHQGYETSHESECSEGQGQVVVKQVIPSKMVPRTWNDKYTHCMRTMKEMAAILSECAEKEYLKRHALLERLKSLWTEGKTALVVDLLVGYGQY